MDETGFATKIDGSCGIKMHRHGIGISRRTNAKSAHSPPDFPLTTTV